MSDKPRFVITLEPTKTARTRDHRDLARLLKTLLRGYGFKCLAIDEAPRRDVPPVAGMDASKKEPEF
jgi:hypothetical protein